MIKPYQLESLRKSYPEGIRVELQNMEGESSLGRLFRNEMDSDNATSAQPQTSQWGRLGENHGEVKFLWCLLNRQTVYAAALASGSCVE